MCLVAGYPFLSSKRLHSENNRHSSLVSLGGSISAGLSQAPTKTQGTRFDTRGIVSRPTPPIRTLADRGASVARLFQQESWGSEGSLDTPLHPQSLSECRKNLNADGDPNQKGIHATAALRDFHPTGERWCWNSREGAWFRIPQYDTCLWPDMDLPVATDNVIEKPEACSYSFRPRG
jgi:hypothetical protein